MQADLRHAMNTWVGEDTEELLLYMADHGGHEKFLLDGNLDPSDERRMLTASELDTWLDELQTVMSGRLILVLDACRSGSFVPRIAGDQRVIVTASDADEDAILTGLWGSSSFSWEFWSYVGLLIRAITQDSTEETSLEWARFLLLNLGIQQDEIEDLISSALQH